MAKVKNETGGAWFDAQSGQRVAKGGVLEVPDEQVWSYVQSDNWSAGDKKTQALADEQRKERDARRNPPAVDESTDEPATEADADKE